MIAFPANGSLDPPAVAGERRLLLVEDHLATRTVLEQVLCAAGYTVDTAGDTAEAEARLAAGTVDLVLLDYTLPSDNGAVVCQRVRARLGAVYPPIIVLTTRGDEAQRRLALAAGADDCLAKPFHPRQLRERVETWLQVGARLRGVRQHMLALEERAARAQLEGAQAVIRAVRHRVNNDLTLPSLVLDYLLEHPSLPEDLRAMVGEAAAAVVSAARYIQALQHVQRVVTTDTPLGPALDLEPSTAPTHRSA
ncbi:MAG TPA: response regulator transcription factor [Chloroflexota bacterium]|jgi:DNA-binding response OmpR family regulator|nr:response regulator transcription factor [Chloroflexota bacterium]